MTPDQTIEDQPAKQLALVSKQMEDHQPAIWLLQDRPNTLWLQLKAVGFIQPRCRQVIDQFGAVRAGDAPSSHHGIRPQRNADEQDARSDPLLRAWLRRRPINNS